MNTRNPQQTRDRLILAAFEQIHAHGFQGMRVDEMLAKPVYKKALSTITSAVRSRY